MDNRTWICVVVLPIKVKLNSSHRVSHMGFTSSFNSLSAMVVFLKELWSTNAMGVSRGFPNIK